MLSSIIDAGTHPDLSLAEKKRIKLLNQIVLVFLSAISIKFFNELYVYDRLGVLITLILMTSFSLTIFLQKYEKYVFTDRMTDSFSTFCLYSI